jgi:hypothetical protein
VLVRSRSVAISSARNRCIPIKLRRNQHRLRTSSGICGSRMTSWSCRKMAAISSMGGSGCRSPNSSSGPTGCEADRVNRYLSCQGARRPGEVPQMATRCFGRSPSAFAMVSINRGRELAKARSSSVERCQHMAEVGVQFLPASTSLSEPNPAQCRPGRREWGVLGVRRDMRTRPSGCWGRRLMAEVYRSARLRSGATRPPPNKTL